MSTKDCGHHRGGHHCGHHEDKNRQLLRHILAAIIAFILLILIIIFLIWIILRPTKPHFLLQDATLYTFNLSSSPTPNTLTLTMQVTLSAHNPNHRVGIYYHNLNVYASYRSQQISLNTVIPNTYQGHKDFTVWSPFIYGNAVPVSPFVLSALQQDQCAGTVLVNVKVNGRVKWKVGTWVSGRYHIYVNCAAFIRFAGDRSNAVGGVATAVKFQLLQSCSVDV